MYSFLQMLAKKEGADFPFAEQDMMKPIVTNKMWYLLSTQHPMVIAGVIGVTPGSNAGASQGKLNALSQGH